MKIYCLGDSLSNNTYETALATLTGATVVSKGVDSNTTTQMLARLNTDVISPGDATHCVVMGGVNDIYTSVSVATIESNLQDIYDDLHAAGIIVVACAIMPWNGSETDVKTVNAWIQNTATNVDYFIDTYKTVNNQASDGNLISLFNSGDGTHLSSTGYSMVASAIHAGMGITDGKIELLIVGGGAGGAWAGGGGGAGGLRYYSSYGVNFASYTVTVGAKGAGGSGIYGTDGGDSIFDSLTAEGGGGGGQYQSQPGRAGGSGGGGGWDNGAGGNGTTGQGNNGGTAYNGVPYTAGGGGGADAVGGNGGAVNGGLGGSGLQFDISGSPQYYAGGGGGSSGPGGADAAGGSGVGGTGEGVSGVGGNAVADTGSGGGGGHGTGSNGGDGSDGIVIIRYKTTDFGDLTGGTKTTDGDYTVHTFKYADTGTSIEFTSGDAAPNTPTNSTPAASATGISRNPTLTASAFSDPDVGDTHGGSQWQIASDSGFTSVVWDSGDDDTNLTSIVVNTTNGTFSGALSGKTKLGSSTTYYFHVRYKDNLGTWSSYSTGTSFGTIPGTVDKNSVEVVDFISPLSQGVKVPILAGKPSMVGVGEETPNDTPLEGTVRLITEDSSLQWYINAAWKTIYTIATLDARYVNVTGDTMTGDLKIQSDSKKLIVGAGDDMSVYYDGTNGYIKTNEIAASDLHISCGTDKTIVLDEPVWEDIQFPISSGRVAVSNAPSWESLTTNTSAFSFAVDDYIDLQCDEPSHGWNEGTNGSVHVHMAIKTAQTSGSSQYAKFTCYLAISDVGGVWSEIGPFTAEQTILNGTAALHHYLLPVGTATLTGYHLGMQIKARIKRIAATTGTEYADSVFITQVGIHVEKVRMGSRSISSA